MESAFVCGAPTRDGGACKNKVAAAGGRCHIKSHQAWKPEVAPAAPVEDDGVPKTMEEIRDCALEAHWAATPTTGPGWEKPAGQHLTVQQALQVGVLRRLRSDEGPQEKVVELVSHEHPDLDALGCVWLARERLAEVLAKMFPEEARQTKGVVISGREFRTPAYLPATSARFVRDEVPSAPGRLIFDMGAANPAAGVFSNHPASSHEGRSSLDIFWDWLGVPEWSKGATLVRQMVRHSDTTGRYLDGLVGARCQFWRDCHLVFLLKGLNLRYKQQPEVVTELVGRVFSAVASYQPKDDDAEMARMVLDRCLALYALQKYQHRRCPWAAVVGRGQQDEGEAPLDYLNRQLARFWLGGRTLPKKIGSKDGSFRGMIAMRVFGLLGIEPRKHYYEGYLVGLRELAEKLYTRQRLTPPDEVVVRPGKKAHVKAWDRPFLLSSMTAAMLSDEKLAFRNTLETVFAFFDAIVAAGLDRCQAAEDYWRGKLQTVPATCDDGRIQSARLGVFRSSASIGEHARERKCNVLVVRTPAGSTYVQFDRQCRLPFRRVVRALRAREAEKRGMPRLSADQLDADVCPLGVWYKHAWTTMNGSLKRSADSMTVLSLEEIEDCVVAALITKPAGG